jgi:ABC-type antimicrobial peptide transport system permease subunit
MNFGRLVLRNLFYHWRGNSAVLLGVAVGAAVLTGALLVGDSLRGSLRDLTLQQLGWVDHSLVAGRFIRQDLADQLGVRDVCPAIFLQGAADSVRRGSAGQTVRRSGRVTILGVNERFWLSGPPPIGTDLWQSARTEAVLNAALADELGVAAGDTISLHLQKVSTIPRESLLGRRDAGEVVDQLKVTVAAVIPNDGPGQFSLNPQPATPRNAFVPLRLLQDRLQQAGRVNALLVGGGETRQLQESLKQHLTLDDWGLILHTPESRTKALFAKLDRNHNGKLERNEWRRRVATSFAQLADQNHDGVLDRAEVLAVYRLHHPYLALESRQMLLEPVAARAAQAAAQEGGLTAAPTLVYLANSISDSQQAIPYSIVAALDPSLPFPLGPFLPAGADRLNDDEIVLADWKESPLHVGPGSSITLSYFLPEIEGRLQEQTQTFRLRGLVPLQGAANDPDLTPEFPGITDKLDIRDWNPPFPYHNELIKPRDEHYWEESRTTPKAYVTLAKGQELWGSRFGQLTSIRLAPTSASLEAGSPDLEKAADDFGRRLLSRLDPKQGGLVFDAVRERGLAGSGGSADFRQLFLAFSFFLIAAALLLVGLLFRLNLDRRGSEVGLLMATGYRRSTLRWLLLAEGSLLAAVGGLLGLVGAVLYAWLMLKLLRDWWPGGLEQSFLRLHATENHGLSFVIGYVSALVVSVLTIAWAVRILGRVSPRNLLAGQVDDTAPAGAGPRATRWSVWLSGEAALGAIILIILGIFIQDPEMKAMTFFGSGALLLTTGLALLWMWMRSSRHSHVGGHGGWALARLGVRNAARHPVRSLLTAGLLASATFVIVAVSSFYRDPGRDFLDRHGGSGGFALLGETDVPLYQDLNTSKGQDELNIPDQSRPTLQGVTFFPFRVRAGDDASCLNLYQPQRPRLLGVPHALVERGGFRFKETEARTPEERANPWLLLEQPRADGALPVFGEANTVEWILHSGLGQELTVPNESGAEVRLRVVGLLQDSVFQSELLLSGANFLKLYPRAEGYSFFLLETPSEQAAAVRSVLETALADQGFTVTPTGQRLQAYLAVENTYLSTFQALGGLGLLLGALGLAVVLLRSVWERRGELALLRALGFRKSALGWLVLAENSFLLIVGLAVGTLTALVSVAPYLLSAQGEVPWRDLLGLIAVVLVIGLVAGAAAVAATLRAPLLPALRRE